MGGKLSKWFLIGCASLVSTLLMGPRGGSMFGAYVPQLLSSFMVCYHGPLIRYVKLWAAHAPGMPGTFSLPPWVSDPDMHHDTCVTHVPWCMLGSLTSGFRWRRWRGKRSRHSRRKRNPQFHVSGKGPIGVLWPSWHWFSYHTAQRVCPSQVDKQRVLMHRHQGWNVRHGLCHIYMIYLYIYELFIAFVCFVVCSLL